MGIDPRSAAGKAVLKALGGRSPGKRDRSPKPATIPPGWVVTLELPFATKSELNLRESWQARHRRKKQQQAAVRAAWLAVRPQVAPPFRVTLTRQGEHLLDPGNLEASFKHVQDAVAALLGVDDGDRAAVAWEYDGVPGVPGTFVRIEPGGPRR